MLEKLIYKATWKTALLFSVIFGVLYYLINFSGFGVAGLLEVTGGPSILDFQSGYSYTEAYEMLTALGVEGRAFYIDKIVPVDFPFPLSYMLCYVGWIAMFLKNIERNKKLKYLIFVPVFAMLCDWAENIGIIAMLRNYPSLPAWAVSVSSVAGTLKMIFTICSFAIIGALMIVWLIVYIKKKRKA